MSTREANAAPSRVQRWPLIICGMLVAHVSAMVLAVQVATGDTGHAVLPDYYARAVGWDDLQAEARASTRLGWSATATPSTLTDADGAREIRVVLEDRSGAPVVGATLSARAWHLALGVPEEFALAPSETPGLYVGRVPMARAGRWHLDVAADQGLSRFVTSFELDVAAPFPIVASDD